MSKEPKFENPDFPFCMVEEDDDSWTFHWDEKHPVTSIFNDWTGQDFLDVIMDAAKRIIAEHEGQQK